QLEPGVQTELYYRRYPATYVIEPDIFRPDLTEGFELLGRHPEFVAWDTLLGDLVKRDLIDPRNRVFNGPVRLGALRADALSIDGYALLKSRGSHEFIHRLDLR
ncbi:MAG: hypothetical protein AAF840_09805, partial [Bacteroidota bacterium]